MRKTLASLLILLFLASLVTLQPATMKAQPMTFVVPDDYSTIQTAVDNAFAGQTIFVKNGVYSEQHITIDKPLSLIGEDPKNTILEGINNIKYSPPYVIQISADNVKVSGFTITNGSLGGIRIETIGSYTQPTGCIITGNNIVNNSDGISTYGGKALSISNNNISDNSEYGIYESSSRSNIFENNITENRWFGIIVDSCNDISINNNNITGNGNQRDTEDEQGGVCLRWYGSFNIYANNITNNNGCGVQFGEGCSNSTVYYNNINGNIVGVDLFNFAITNNSENIGIGLDNTVYGNNFDNPQNAFIETAFAYGNITNIYYAIGNGTDVVSWDNGKIGNYWSDYTDSGTYLIDENNIDHHPLMQHVDISESVPTPTPVESNTWISILTIAVIIMVVVVACFLIYFKKRKQTWMG